MNDLIDELTLNLVDLRFWIGFESLFHLELDFLQLIHDRPSYLTSLAMGCTQLSDLVLDVFGFELG
jgi:hypothetical protein